MTSLLLVLLAGVSPSVPAATDFPLAERLVKEAQTLAHQRYARPTHVATPRLGSFGDGLGARLEALTGSQVVHDALPPEILGACVDAAEGIGHLPRACRDAVTVSSATLRAILTSTHAAEAGVPPGMRALPDPEARPRDSGWPLVQHAARLATYALTLELEAERPERAVEICVDGSALARDLSLGTGLMGNSAASTIQSMFATPCSRALAAAPSAAREAAIEQLRRIRSTAAPLSRALQEEQIQASLAAFGSLLQPVQLSALPPEAKAVVRENIRSYSPIQTAMLRSAWIEYSEFMDALIAAADLPPEARSRQFSAARERMLHSLNPLSRASAPDFEPVGKRWDRARASVDRLLPRDPAVAGAMKR